ncbi:MAG TPA: methyltransferase domain-containing protein [Marmoricola sp.]|nr:methyltransferase domain-containing protein [Marmoricola sp.]
MLPDATIPPRPHDVLDRPFGSLRISYDERLLEPRDWTTAQSYWAADLMGSTPEGPVLELCAGAGHIGLLAIATRPRDLVAVDLNPVACGYVERNATAAGLAERVQVREGDIEGVLGADELFAVVIADPPWVRRAETSRFPEDPLLAIDGGDDGLDLARSCVRTIGRHLLPGGSGVLQLGNRAQVTSLADLVAESGLQVRETRDYERGVLVRLDRARS